MLAARRVVRGLAPWLVAASLGGCADAPARPVVGVRAPGAAPAASLTLREPLGHRWTDELLHFDLDAAAGDVHLTDGAGAPVLTQRDGAFKGRIWTVGSLEPGGVTALQLHAGPPPSGPLPGAVSVSREPGGVVLANDRLAIAIPDWSAAPRGELGALPAPLRAVRRPGGAWLGEAAWVNDGPPLPVVEAATTVIEAGPVRAAVRQRLRFADGKSYEAVITLGARQEAALVTEDSDESAPRAAFRLSLAADHVVWHNQHGAAEGAPSWELIDTAPAFDRERVVCKLRPWSFWWLSGLSMWAGFHARGSDALVGVLALRPSRWSPHQWDGFDRTEIPVTARPGGRLDLTFALAAGKVRIFDAQVEQPLHREWALSATATGREETAAAREKVLRAELVKYAEFPLDEVKDYGFDAPLRAAAHPSLLYTAADAERARRQLRTSPVLAARIEDNLALLNRCGDLQPILEKRGTLALSERYAQYNLFEAVPETYLATGDPLLARYISASLQGLVKRLVALFLEAPERPALGSYGPWFTEEVTRLVLNWDLVADLLPPEQAVAARHAMVFGAHVLAHPDYWNVSRGMCGTNANMTSAIVLPRGLLGLALAGHPEAEGWVRGAEEAIHRELDAWVSPGGAWVENPYYQSAWLDGAFLLMGAIKNVTGRDLFADPHLRETMDYYGFLLTPPDRRFPVKGAPAPMVMPSVGNAFAGLTTPFNGWMARATAASDPVYSARQQFFWRQQASMMGNAGRAKGFVPALTDPDLPASPPVETSRGFPGFGSVLRSGWTDPNHSYVAHRTGPNVQHYDQGDYGSFVYYAKGAPLCLDWGDYSNPHPRGEPWFHNGVSFEDGSAPARIGMSGELREVRSLPGFLELSYGKTRGAGPQESHRHLLMVESRDPLGATYLVIRDRTVDGVAGQRFYWNLFCLAGEPKVEGAVAHFPGQMGVDLDVHVLSPQRPEIRADRWSWKHWIPTWGVFSEEQHGIHVPKAGSGEDFFTVLYPRAPGEAAPRVSAIGGGTGARIAHAEGVDLVLLAPGRPSALREGDAALSGEIALVRRTRKGALRLAVLAGDGASAEAGGFGVQSSGPAALEIDGRAVSGESSGAAHEVRVTLPEGRGWAAVEIDGEVAPAERAGRVLVLALPAGVHRFSIRP